MERGPEMWSQKMFTNDLSTLIKSVSIMSYALARKDCRGQDPVLSSRGLGKMLWRKLVRDTFRIGLVEVILSASPSGLPIA